MNITVQIYYSSESGNKILQRGSFPAKRKTEVELALEFWKWIKSESNLEIEIEKVIVDGEDMTEEVKEAEATYKK